MITSFGRNLRAFLESKNILQQEFADQIGVTLTTVNGWINRGTQPRAAIISQIKEKYGLSDDDLMSTSNGYYAKQSGLAGSVSAPGAGFTATAPVLGAIHAGDPQEAIESAGEEHELPQRIKDRFPTGFFLVVKGDSMNLVLPEGCYAFIAPNEVLPVKSGDIAAVKVNGDDATIKLVKLFDGVVILEPQSTNPAHKRRVIDENDPDAPDVRLLGKVVWYDYQIVKF